MSRRMNQFPSFAQTLIRFLAKVHRGRPHLIAAAQRRRQRRRRHQKLSEALSNTTDGLLQKKKSRCNHIAVLVADRRSAASQTLRDQFGNEASRHFPTADGATLDVGGEEGREQISRLALCLLRSALTSW